MPILSIIITFLLLFMLLIIMPLSNLDYESLDLKNVIMVWGSLLQVPILLWAIFVFKENSKDTRKLIESIRLTKDTASDSTKTFNVADLSTRHSDSTLVSKTKISKGVYYYETGMKGYKDLSYTYNMKYPSSLTPEVSNGGPKEEENWIPERDFTTRNKKGFKNMENINVVKVRLKLNNLRNGNELTIRIKKKAL